MPKPSQSPEKSSRFCLSGGGAAIASLTQSETLDKMGKQRYINTKFWSDSFIVELNPLDRYLFLYILTNEHTNIAGIYELPIIRMAQESGIDKEMIPKMLRRLSGKIEYFDGWVIIKNFQKHQMKNEKIKLGIENVMKEVPQSIKNVHFKLIKSRVKKSYPMDTLSIAPELSKSNLNSNLNSIATDVARDKINEFIELFKVINPSYEQLFKNKTQRAALGRLIKKYGEEKTANTIKALPGIINKPYAPKITTPYELERDLGKLLAFYNQEKTKGVKKSVPIIG